MKAWIEFLILRPAQVQKAEVRRHKETQKVNSDYGSNRIRIGTIFCVKFLRTRIGLLTYLSFCTVIFRFNSEVPNLG